METYKKIANDKKCLQELRSNSKDNQGDKGKVVVVTPLEEEKKETTSLRDRKAEENQ